MRQDHQCRTVARSEQLVLGGQAADAIELLGTLPEPARDRPFWLLLGDAYRANGDFAAARMAYHEVRPQEGPAGFLDTGVAWRRGMINQQQGEPRLALEIYHRASTTEGDLVDQAWLLAGMATAHWLLGDTAEAVAQAHAARERAAATGDHRTLAAAHVALALSVSLNGDPATVDEHYARAAGYAAEAGDLVQIARIDVNRSHHLLADARFAEAVDTASAAGAAAEKLGSPALLAVALGNEGEGLVRLGRYDEAMDCFERALSLASQIGTRGTTGALVGLAQVHLRRGAGEQARAALEQALRLTCTDGDRQVRVPALACLATALLPDEANLASALAAEALDAARGSSRLPALLAAGRTAWARGEVETARALAAKAVEHARQRRERAWLAEALEFRAATVDKTPARAALREAHQIWQDSGATHDADRVLVQAARFAPSSAPDRLAARLATARLTAAGVLASARAVQTTDPVAVRIRTFGRFEVYVDGVAVPAEAWQSRRARELLRLLVCRRGRTIPRPEICELLWPDDDPDRTGHRLSVLLSIVRGVAGPEAVVADQACVALDSTKVQVDVEEFLADVDDAVALHQRGAATDARTLLTEAVRRYTDEPFADAPYDDATSALREEARAAQLQALRLLAELCRHAGEDDQAAMYLRRLLAADPYDEDAHRRLLAVLVEAGQHGQARLGAARYRAAMADLGLAPAV